MPKSTIKHTHIYKKLTTGNYRCIKPDCPTTIEPERLEARRAECPYCTNTFIVTKEHLRRKLIHCMECTKNRVPVTIIQEENNKVFENLLNQNDPLNSLIRDPLGSINNINNISKEEKEKEN